MKILRKRYIPDECMDISSDEVLFRDQEIIITKWSPIKPRNDFAGGISYTFLKEGYKIGNFLNENGEHLYWYCDVIDVDYDILKDQYTLIDLLVDIKVDNYGVCEVLDLDELADAIEKEIITKEQVCKALKITNNVLSMIKRGEFPPQICKENGFDFEK